MIKGRFHLTKAGLQQFMIEHERLLARRGPIAEQLKAAHESGDPAENAEYISACQEQERLEGRIAEIENILGNAKIIKNPRNSRVVRLGSIIKLKNNGKSKKLQIVDTVEADPLLGKISDESPIGRVLLGKRVGDAIEIKTPINTAVYRVVYIS